MTDELQDIAEAIARLRDRIFDQEEQNQPPEQITVAESQSEDIGLDDSTTTTAKSGDDRYLTFDDPSTTMDFSETK